MTWEQTKITVILWKKIKNSVLLKGARWKQRWVTLKQRIELGFYLFSSLKESMKYFDLKYGVSWFYKACFALQSFFFTVDFSLQACLSSFWYLDSLVLFREFRFYFYRSPCLVWKPLHKNSGVLFCEFPSYRHKSPGLILESAIFTYFYVISELSTERGSSIPV